MIRKIVLICLFCCAVNSVYAEVSQDEAGADVQSDAVSPVLTGATAEQAMQVFQVFTKKCADCHGGHRKKPKGSFGYVLDLERLGNDVFYVTKGDPEDSELYRLLVTEDEDELMPPADSEVGAMTEAEIKAVYDWIKTGAGIGVQNQVEEPENNEVEQLENQHAEAEQESEFSLSIFTGHLHPLLVHFPIALLLVAALCECGFIYCQCKEMLFSMRLCLYISTVAAFASIISGWINANVEGYANDTVWTHRWGGVVFGVLSVILIIVDLLRKRDPEINYYVWIFRILMLIAVFLIALVGHTGGELVYGEGYFG